MRVCLLKGTHLFRASESLTKKIKNETHLMQMTLATKDLYRIEMETYFL